MNEQENNDKNNKVGGGKDNGKQQSSTTFPSFAPSSRPSHEPTHSPTNNPTNNPSKEPTLHPTTTRPSISPTTTTTAPTLQPSQRPIPDPPTQEPTATVTATVDSSDNTPTPHPSLEGTLYPTATLPTLIPSSRPSVSVTFSPSHKLILSENPTTLFQTPLVSAPPTTDQIQYIYKGLQVEFKFSVFSKHYKFESSINNDKSILISNAIKDFLCTDTDWTILGNFEFGLEPKCRHLDSNWALVIVPFQVVLDNFRENSQKWSMLFSVLTNSNDDVNLLFNHTTVMVREQQTQALLDLQISNGKMDSRLGDFSDLYFGHHSADGPAFLDSSTITNNVDSAILFAPTNSLKFIGVGMFCFTTLITIYLFGCAKRIKKPKAGEDLQDGGLVTVQGVENILHMGRTRSMGGTRRDTSIIK